MYTLLIISFDWLIRFLIILIIIGVALYLINRFLPMDPKIKSIFNIIIVVAVVIYLLYMLTRIL